MELCVPVRAQIKSEECLNCALVPFLLRQRPPACPRPRDAAAISPRASPRKELLPELEPRVSCRRGTRPEWIRTWPEGVTSPCTRTEKSAGHKTATCLKTREKKINTCLKLTASNQPQNDLFGARQGRKITQTMGSKCAK